jgi:hypothetical protein
MGEGLIETVLEQRAVGQPGQGVVLGQVGDALEALRSVMSENTAT